MPKVKVIKRYNDRKLKAVQKVGDQFETDQERADYLADQGLVTIIDTKLPGKKTEDAK